MICRFISIFFSQRHKYIYNFHWLLLLLFCIVSLFKFLNRVIKASWHLIIMLKLNIFNLLRNKCFSLKLKIIVTYTHLRIVHISISHFLSQWFFSHAILCSFKHFWITLNIYFKKTNCKLLDCKIGWRIV